MNFFSSIGYFRIQSPYSNQPWNMLPLDRPKPPTSQPEHEPLRPPNLERNEPIIKYKSVKKSGSTKKTAQGENEKMVVCYLCVQKYFSSC